MEKDQKTTKEPTKKMIENADSLVRKYLRKLVISSGKEMFKQSAGEEKRIKRIGSHLQSGTPRHLPEWTASES